MRQRDEQTALDAQKLEPDGRRRRSQRSRERILAALAEALSEPDIELTPEQIAARSGYSISTIFRHFGDQEGLTRAMRELVFARVQGTLSVGAYEGDRRQRVVELVRRCAAIYETVAPLVRTLARNRYTAEAEENIGEIEQAIRGQILLALGPELTERRDPTEAILAALLSIGTWSHMRWAQDLSSEQGRALLETAVLRVLVAAP